MRNIKIVTQYNGQNYCGWQKQPNSLGIQGTIEKAIYEITKENVKITGSGRTDAGVHALGQVANFKIESSIPADRIPSALNAKLPKDISIIECVEVDDEFHARYSAKGKTYRYLIHNSDYRSPIYKDISYHVKYELDFEKMIKEAKHLIGEHDFKSFTKNHIIENTVRTIYDINFEINDGVIKINFIGNGFLHNMVRIIVAMLIEVGNDRVTIEQLQNIMDMKNRKLAPKLAPANALYLMSVEY